MEIDFNLQLPFTPLMTHPDTTPTLSLKFTLLAAALIFAAAAAILIIFATSAATGTGSAPALAVSLVAGPNTGLMTPGEQRWFRFTPDDSGHLEKSLTLMFTPGYEQSAAQVQFQLFEENQVASGNMANFGAGQVVSRDGNPETGELLWTGWVFGQQNYYVQVLNGSSTPIDYWLFTDDVSSYALGDASPQAAPAPIMPTAAPADLPATDQPAPLPTTTARQHGHLPPHSTQWYTVDQSRASGKGQFVNLSYTLFITPEDGSRGPRVNFKLFPAQAVEQWQRGELAELVNFGAGALVSRDGDPNTGERVWQGVVLRNEAYRLAIENESDAPIDYWLFEGDIYHPNLQP